MPITKKVNSLPAIDFHSQNAISMSGGVFMFKVLDKYLHSLFCGWNSLSKRASLRVRDQAFLLITVMLLGQINFLIWFIALYAILALRQ
jgi:hypothetical protein